MNTTIETQQLIGLDKIMDVRLIPCTVKHGLIIRTWLNLQVGDYFILRNDHDPVPLYYQFAAQWPSAFSWDYVAKERGDVRVRITKLKQVSAVAAPVPGSCGGH
jgi:uncharacterized protein (DUF2249 family)